jgi:glycosyltransferase involved in cell wall biosynthesis
LKVLILSHSSDLGGAEQSMLGLFDELRKTTEIEPEFIIRKPLLGLAMELKNRGLSYHALYYTNWAQRNPTYDPNEIYWYAKQNTKAVADIEKIIRKIRPGVVITNTIVAPWAAIAARNQTIPHVWFIREFGDVDSGFEFRLGHHKTFEIVGKLSDLVVANSEALAKFAAKFINPSKITIVYPTLEIKKIKQLSADKVTNPYNDQKSLKLVITGRIAPSKGQHIAAEAVGILKRHGVRCELCIVGSPSSQGDDNLLRATIQKYDISDQVHLIGQQSNPYAYMALADIGIMASENEAFGRVSLEYMALGKPVVGSNSGATPELIKSNANGSLFNTGDASDLANQLLKYSKDSSLINKHGGASSKMAVSIAEGKYMPKTFYEKLQHIAAGKPKAKSPTDGEWNNYPIILGPNTKRPPLKFSWHNLTKAFRRLLKRIYIGLR